MSMPGQVGFMAGRVPGWGAGYALVGHGCRAGAALCAMAADQPG